MPDPIHDRHRHLSDRHREVALFRYSLIREAADPSLTKAERGAVVRALAEREHRGPRGEPVVVARNSIDRWIRAWRAGGFDALAPATRSAEATTPAATLELAVKLKAEAPGRTAVQVAAIIVACQGSGPSGRTIQRLFARLGLNTRPDGSPPEAFGRFEATAANDRWTGDALHGPVIGGQKSYLFAFIDDYSRALVGYRFGHSEDSVRLEAALRHGLGSRGVPRSIYVDNGSAFVAAPLLRACAVLGIRLVHSRPGRPEGRGKIERFFRTVRDQFLVEVAHRVEAHQGVGDLVEMNRLFAAWVETVYHRRVHTETKASPLERFMAGAPFAIPTPAMLHEAFLWSENRMVTKTATVSLHANTFEVDAALVGRRVECVFDPFDLTAIEVRYQGRAMGAGIARVIGRHTHPRARPEAAPAPVPSGIDYLGLLADRHAAALAEASPAIAYLALAESTDAAQCPGQLMIPESPSTIPDESASP